MGDVVDRPPGDQELCQLGQAPGRRRQVVVLRAGQGDLLELPAFGEGEGGRTAAGVLRRERVEAVVIEVAEKARTRSSEVKAIVAIWGTPNPWADQRTSRALRHRTTEPGPRRTIARSLRPSSLVISRTRLRSAVPMVRDLSVGVVDAPHERCRSRHGPVLVAGRRAQVPDMPTIGLFSTLFPVEP